MAHMVDSIGNKASTPPVERRVVPVAPAAGTSAVQAVATPVKEQTAGAEQVQSAALSKQMAAEAPVDSDRVTRIKNAIANGTFPIYPTTIADRLLALKMQWNPNDQA
jgi:negative regulator of flagellin synthesis FlgM